jgi:hypothetical protein
MGQMRNSYKMLTAKRDGKTPLGRARRRWEYNIKMNLRETGLDDIAWVHMRYSGGLLRTR